MESARRIAEVFRRVPRMLAPAEHRLCMRPAPRPVTAASIQRRLDAVPYFVERTAHGRELPVYRAYTHGGSCVRTVVRHVWGDADALAADVVRRVGVDARRVLVRRAHQSLVVRGDHRAGIVRMLSDIGF